MAVLPSGVYITGQGPAIIFLHSSLSSSKQWLPLINILQDRFTCINIDILGYGKAEKVVDDDNYNFDIELERIRFVLENSIGDQPYHLIGHSCGGAIALKLAVEAPKKLLSVSLYEPVAFHLLEEGSEERAQANSFSSNIAKLSNEKAAQTFIDFWNEDGFYLSLPNKVQMLMEADMQKVNLDFKGLISERYQLNDLAKILCPAMIFCGLNSPHLSQFLADKIANALPNGKLCQLNTGHMGPINQPELVLAKIAEFLLN